MVVIFGHFNAYYKYQLVSLGYAIDTNDLANKKWDNGK